MLDKIRRQRLGSMTAMGGFRNELTVVDKLNHYKSDADAQIWLNYMGFDPSKIQSLEAIQLKTRISRAEAIRLGVEEIELDNSLKFKKADVQIKINIQVDKIIYRVHLSLKKATKANFNQIDKRPVDTYQTIWGFDDEMATCLKQFTGEINPFSSETFDSSQLRDVQRRRLWLDELPKSKIDKILNFFELNKYLIVSDTLKGKGFFSSDYMLVTREKKEGVFDWLIEDINSVCNFYSQGAVKLSDKGGLIIGRISAQRKGGTPDPTSLQFKFRPLDLFENGQ